MSRTMLQHVLRAVILALALSGPLLWPSGVPIAAAALGALIAYDGTAHRVLLGAAALAVAAELIGGMHLGIVSLPFLGAALLLALASRIFSVTPWAGTDGWSIGDLIRTIVLGAVLSIAILTGSVLVGSFVYSLGMTVARLKIALDPGTLLAMATAVAVMVVLLRRIDVPFRRRIRFGM